jgi:anaerobic magnesium-protoporphyrin IX monomethyl ester cyclase
MKISLLMCPLWNIDQPPLATAYISGQLKSFGHDIVCHDFSSDLICNLPAEKKTVVTQRYLIEGWNDNFEFWRERLSIDSLVDKWADEVLAHNPGLVGFSLYDSTLSVSMLLTKAIKKISPETYVVFGGPACDEKEIILKGSVDFLVYGEGEDTITDLVDRIQNNRSFEDCPGIVFVRKGDIVKTDPRPLIQDINKIPFPDFSNFDLKKYPLQNLPMFTSRGCPNRCTFCSESPRWGKYRHRTAENIVLEMERNVSEFGITHFSMEDSTINGDTHEFEKMCDLIISKELKVTWGGKARIHPKMNRNYLEKVYMAGCRGFIFGIESGSQKVIDHMNKNIKISDVETVIRNAREVGIRVGCFFIVGYVNESEEDFEETLTFIMRNHKYIDTIYPGSGLYILKGSLLYKEAKQYGIVFPEGSPNSEWSTEDKSNTSKVRSDRLVRFNNLMLAILENKINQLEEQIVDLEHSRKLMLANLENKINQLEGQIVDLEHIRKLADKAIQVQAAALNTIFRSRGWKVLRFYYKLRDALLPIGSKRQAAIKKSVNSMIKLIKKI